MTTTRKRRQGKNDEDEDYDNDDEVKQKRIFKEINVRGKKRRKKGNTWWNGASKQQVMTPTARAGWGVAHVQAGKTLAIPAEPGTRHARSYLFQKNDER